jgi:hypothetical protein
MKEFNQRMINNIIPIIVLIKLNIHVIRQNIIKIQFTINKIKEEIFNKAM